MADFSIQGQLIDLHQRCIYPVSIEIRGGIIESIKEIAEAPEQYILPGFVDAHVHIESSMLTPAQFAKMAVVHGTVATVSDPHEIANVCGKDGIQWMIDNARTVPFKCFFGAPSCVPATNFETAGSELNAEAIDNLLASSDIWYLAEMMNYPGVLHGEPEVMAKIEAAKKYGKPIDGHAPGLKGMEARAYAQPGITTDHECTTLEEALDKIAAGMQILIREGSAAKNYEALHSLLRSHPERVMFCSDDKHPDDLVVSHINALVKRAIDKGYDRFDVLRAACVHPVQHYGLPVGLLREGDAADFIVVNDLASWMPTNTYIGGRLVAEKGRCLFEAGNTEPINRFAAESIDLSDLSVNANGGQQFVRAIVAQDGQLVTGSTIVTLRVRDSVVIADAELDVLKLVVIDRYQQRARPAIGFIHGFGLLRGALASTVAHDCHNIIAVGVDDESICAAINALIAAKGGIAVANSPVQVQVLPLPIAGLMSTDDAEKVGEMYAQISREARELGSNLTAPFMTLSFMALLVIPSLKLSDKGLFDGTTFAFAPCLLESA